MADYVAVVMGGTSPEREISLQSGQSVLAALQSSGINAVAIDPKMQSLLQLKEAGFTHIFNILHGERGEDGTVQGLYELLQLPYTGSGVLASALTMDKLKSKLLFQALGLPVVPYRVIEKGTEIVADEIITALGLPLIVKPVHQGSSVGMSKVRAKEELTAAIKTGFNYDRTLLIETCLGGPEFTVAIVGEHILPSIRIQPASGFYDYAAKYVAEDTQFYCPGSSVEKQEKQLQQLALRAYRAVGCRGWGRIDIMLDDKNNPYLLEINTAPGMTNHSLVPTAAKAYGWSFAELVKRILALAATDY